MDDKFNVFLHFLSEDIDQNISSLESGLVFMEAVIICIDRADCEKGTVLFYQGSNKDMFLEQLRLIQEFSEIGNFGTIPPEVSINYLLQEINAENWEENPHYTPNECKYQIVSNKGGQQIVINDIPDVLKEIYERKTIDYQSKCILLNLYNSFIFNDKEINICKICNDDAPDCKDVFYVKNFNELDEYFNTNRKTRKYNSEDYRHIEGHPKYIKNPPKSPLLGGLAGRKNASNLLSQAIGDKKETQRLYNFDENKKRYIQFEYEGDNPQNQYYGYHLVKPQTHEIDKKAVNDIPQRVIKILEYRQRND